MIYNALLILDVDRTILDTDALGPLWFIALQKAGANQQIEHDVQLQIASTAGSFDVYGYILEKYPEIAEAVATSVRSDMLEILQQSPPNNCGLFMPHAQQFLDKLADYPVLFMTSGGREWQAMKLDLISQSQEHNFQKASVNWHSLITPRSDKGTMLQAVYDRGVFRITALPDCVHDYGTDDVSAAKLALIDDKLVSFVNLPAEVEAYHFLAAGYQPNSRQISVSVENQMFLSSNIQTIDDLFAFDVDNFYATSTSKYTV